MNSFLLILVTIILFSGIISLGYFLLFNNLLAHKIKIKEAESVIYDLLKRKKELLFRIRKVISEKTDVNKKVFSPFKKLDETDLSAIELERRLTECYKLLDKIKKDHKVINQGGEVNNLYNDLYLLDEKLEAAKTFYNKYTHSLNNQVKKFPTNLISKIHRITSLAYYDVKKEFNK
jgi:hypothetical protein